MTSVVGFYVLYLVVHICLFIKYMVWYFLEMKIVLDALFTSSVAFFNRCYFSTMCYVFGTLCWSFLKIMISIKIKKNKGMPRELSFLYALQCRITTVLQMMNYNRIIWNNVNLIRKMFIEFRLGLKNKISLLFINVTLRLKQPNTWWQSLISQLHKCWQSSP